MTRKRATTRRARRGKATEAKTTKVTKAASPIVGRPVDLAAQPAPPPASLAEFTTPPADPLEANAALHRMVVLTAYNAAQDPRIGDRERRKEIRAITAVAAKLTPDTRRYEAEQAIKTDRRELEERARSKRRAKLVPVKYPGAA